MSALADATNTINTETENVVEKVLVNDVDAKIATDASAEVTTEAAASVPSSDATTEVESASEAVSPAEAATVEESALEAVAPVEEAKGDVETSAEGAVETAQVVVEESKEQKQEKLNEHLISGRRFLKTSNFDKATEMLSVAAALSDELFGEGHEDTFEATFLYGQALLEMAKIEDEVLTNALTDIPKPSEGEEEVQDDVVENPEDVPQEERAEIKKKVEEALGVASEDPIEEEAVAEVAQDDAQQEDNAQQEGNAAVEKGEDANGEEVQDGEQDNAEEKTEDVEMEVEPAEEGQDQEGSDDEGDEDEPMKLAWEILESARCICEKKIKHLEAQEKTDAEELKKWALNHADVLTSLGEHGVVDSKYEQAQKDLFAALEIQAAHLPASSRLLANTNHLLGKAFMADACFENAATHYSNAKNILIAKTEELKKQVEAAAEEDKKNIESEIKELEELIPELDAIIVDARASEEQTIKIKEIAKKELESAAEAINKIAAEETNDITSLVRRPAKRPATEVETTEEVKKRKSEDGSSAIASETAMEGTEESVTALPAE